MPRPETLAARVRLELLLRQLVGHLPAPPATVADLGAGDGWLGVALARRGYRVTLLDASERMVALARGRVAAAAADVAERLEVVHGRAEEAEDVLGPVRHDVVCCHAVLPVAPDVPRLLGVLARLVPVGGTVSLVAKNARALAMRAGLAGRYDEALALLDGAVERDDDGTVLAGHDVDVLVDRMRRVGIHLQAWYGVQTFTAHRDEIVDDATVQRALALEERAGRSEPYRRVARQVHLVGRRDTVAGERPGAVP